MVLVNYVLRERKFFADKVLNYDPIPPSLRFSAQTFPDHHQGLRSNFESQGIVVDN